MTKTALKISTLAAAIALGMSSASVAQTWSNAGAQNTNPSETTQNGNATEQLMLQHGAGSSAVGTNDSAMGSGYGAGYGMSVSPVSPKNTVNPTESQRGDSTIEELRKR
ncbi:hypothetical protein [Chthonobacter rhizosphaerae]|uniref:hypothetical protein n=1 Tax=Chthonobacter rhizosphaerae TaxID=2735553 RepID=UPI0015EECA59|nr:hypothetical protein [Chthonobacter rhizosphaerae]